MNQDYTINAMAKNVIFGSIVDGENGLYITDHTCDLCGCKDNAFMKFGSLRMFESNPACVFSYVFACRKCREEIIKMLSELSKKKKEAENGD